MSEQEQPATIRSWWLDLDREAFDKAAERELARMAKSEAAARLRGVTIGWGDAISGNFR